MRVGGSGDEDEAKCDVTGGRGRSCEVVRRSLFGVKRQALKVGGGRGTTKEYDRQVI